MRIFSLSILAVCSAPCQNGGICIAPSVCQCKISVDNNIRRFSILSFIFYLKVLPVTLAITVKNVCIKEIIEKKISFPLKFTAICNPISYHDQLDYQGPNTTCQHGGTCIAPNNCSVSVYIYLKHNY